MASKWKELISTTDEQSVIIDIPSWTLCAMLDAIGKGVLLRPTFHFISSCNNISSRIQLFIWHSRQPGQTSYYHVYKYGVSYLSLFYLRETTLMNNLLHRFDTFAAATENSALSLCLMDWLPRWIVWFFVEKAPVKWLDHLRKAHNLTLQVAKQLLNDKYEAFAADKLKRDIMSLLGTLPSLLFSLPAYTNLTCTMTVKANISENPKTWLGDKELLSQIKCVWYLVMY